MLRDFDALPEDPSELRAVSKLLAAEVKSQALMIEKLKHQLAGHNRHRFGSKSESLDQLNLAFAEEEEIAEAAEKQAAPSPDSTDADKPARQHSRKPLPDHLDRHEEVLSPGDDCNRCGGSLKTLGEDVTEELEYVPGRFVVNRIVRPLYTTNAIESLNRVIRKSIKTRGSFPTEEAATKLIYLAIRNFEKGGRNVREWFAARNQFAIMFDERFNA